ncbi:MAG: hypothetical protein MJ214_05055 [Bacilli bacterium]|nr:hypothetical protein [Bacilli bacterium]
MKFNKIFVSLVALSATGVATLVSCGGGGSPAQTPSVYVYARTDGNGGGKRAEKSVVSKEKGAGAQVYYDDEVLTYTVENAENLRYGEQDVVVHIKPRLFFHLTERYNEETWEAEGDPVIPYVGLGSPNNRYSYELPRNVAWTYEREDATNADEKTESYKLVVKKEFFQKNIVVGYGYAKDGKEPTVDNYAKVVTSTVYEEEIKSFSLETIKDLKVGQKPTPDMNAFIRNDQSANDFSVVSEGMTLVYGKSSKASDLVTLDSIPSTLTESGTDYAQIVVYGVKYDKDSPTKITMVDKLSHYSEDDSSFTVRRVGSFEDGIAVFLDWKSLIEDDKYYTQKYDDIYIGIDPIYKCDVTTTYDSTYIEKLNSGYCFGKNVKTTNPEEDFSNRPFCPRGPFAFKTDDNKYIQIKDVYPDVRYSYEECAPYFVTFIYSQDPSPEKVKWPTVDISYTDSDGQTASIRLVTDEEKVYPGAMNCQFVTELANSEGSSDALEKAKWVLFNVQDEGEITDEFVLYPTGTAEAGAFVPPTEWALAKSVNINISAGK